MLRVNNKGTKTTPMAKYFKIKQLEKPYFFQIFLFYILILRYQFPNGMINKIVIYELSFLQVVL